MERANTNNENGEGSSHTSTPPIEPYRPKAKYTINEIVTPRTIIPTCYFHVQSITYDSHAQSHMYTLKSLPYIGDHYQPDLTRTVFEGDLRSMSNIRKDQHQEEWEGRVPSSWLRTDSDEEELADLTNAIHIGTGGRDMRHTIEVGDIVDVRANSKGEEWVPGVVIGTNSQHGLWRCFLVSVDPNDSPHTLPCSERLLKLVQKGNTVGGLKKHAGNVVKRSGAAGKVRQSKAVLTRRTTGYRGAEQLIPENGLCFGDAGKLG